EEGPPGLPACGQGSRDMIGRVASDIASQARCSKHSGRPRAPFIAGIALVATSICLEQASALTQEQAVENCRATVGKPIVQACMPAPGKGGNLEACRAQATPKVRACVQAALNAANGRANVPVAVPSEPKPSSTEEAEIAAQAAAPVFVAPPRTIS